MRIFIIVLLAWSQMAAAEAVFRCVDDNGKVTFTKQNCPAKSNFTGVVSAHNQAPSGSSAPVRMAETAQPASTAAAAPGNSQVVVVGGQKPCSTGMSAQDHRTSRVKGEAVQGMTKDEIQSIYGKPDNVTTANGSDSYRYWNANDKKYVSVSFDKQGCANWVYQSQDKKN